MNTPAPLPWKANRPRAVGPVAELAPPARRVGDPKGVAEGVRTALRPDSQPSDAGNPTPDRPGIRIYAPPVYRHHYDGARWTKRYSDTPTAAYACPCGQTDTATGRDNVADLVADYDYHRTTCPHLNPQEGRRAA
ncbi:hypothetical protein [Streptomyces sp. NBC_00019]|uniref:hypothetical protein n=1 Tax=Streptomyces sp. NBC_00019 TaxID=2975623 RepID=UPI0032556FA1